MASYIKSSMYVIQRTYPLPPQKKVLISLTPFSLFFSADYVRESQ
jgi:hypothetical protein